MEAPMEMQRAGYPSVSVCGDSNRTALRLLARERASPWAHGSHSNPVSC